MEASREDVSKLKELLNAPRPQRSLTPLHANEIEEDVKFQQEMGLIDKVMAEAILREMDFENSEVTMHGIDDL